MLENIVLNLEDNYLSLKKEDNHNKKQQVRLAAFFMKKDYKLSWFFEMVFHSIPQHFITADLIMFLRYLEYLNAIIYFPKYQKSMHQVCTFLVRN